MAAGSTYVPIATTTFNGSTGTITFSSIPSIYTDLVCIFAGTAPSYTIGVRFNGDTGTNYSYTRVSGNGASASSYRASNFNNLEMVVPNSGDFGTALLNIQNYSNTTTYKSSIWRAGGGGSNAQYSSACVGLWRSTSAITSVTVFEAGSGSFGTGSTATLYGIASA